MRGRLGVFILALMFGAPAWAGDDVEATYKKYCASCHGMTGDGNGHAQMKVKPIDFRSPIVQNSTDEKLFQAIGHGVGHKEYAHAFADRGMDAKQIADLVTYIRKLAKTAKKTN
ncbi:MAG TPA: cytochrome c [Methylomirabilota bacterium]|nr:cytochrome c [Methylomirabilota bacterium]